MSKHPFSKLTGPKRLALAKERADKLVHHIVPLFLMHEANGAIVYSQQLAAQIPPSYAAHAFNQFQRGMHLFEIIRLCALWDAPGADRESIPTIIALFNKTALIEQLVNDACTFHMSDIPPDSVLQEAGSKSWWKQDRAEITQLAEITVREKLAFAINKTAEVQVSERLKALMDFRHRYIAHNLDTPEPDLAEQASVARFKYGDETTVLEDTVAIADALHRGLNQIAFDWAGARDMARRNARALWDSCTFRIQARRPQGRAPVSEHS